MVRRRLHLRPVLGEGPFVTVQNAADAFVPHPAAAFLLPTLGLPHGLRLRVDAFGTPAVPGEGVGPGAPGRLPNGGPGGTAFQFLGGQPLQKRVGPGEYGDRGERTMTVGKKVVCTSCEAITAGRDYRGSSKRPFGK